MDVDFRNDCEQRQHRSGKLAVFVLVNVSIFDLPPHFFRRNACEQNSSSHIASGPWWNSMVLE
jgi:hypothetical protein